MKNAEDRRYKRTLFVSLGGAGAKTLRRLKKKISDANGGTIPKQIKFLLIDTNATELANYRDFDSSEKICIAVREPYLRYKHDQETGASTHEYIPTKNVHSLLALERGAGQIRSNGHFAVIENQYSKKLEHILREKADEIEDISIDSNSLEKDPKIEVRLVFSIAGGTGSGTFLPIATIIRASIKHSELTAYVYSATHFERFVENSAKQSVMQNAYAAFCELDYMMHFGMEGYQPVEFSFGPHENQKMECQNRPFDEVYYIDKRTDIPTPDTLEFTYNEIKRLQDNTADIIHIASSSIISSHTGTVDNVRQKIMEGQFNVGDKFAWVSGVGIAKLCVNQTNDNEETKRTALNAINVRLSDKVDTSFVNEVASGFIGSDYCEDNGSNDRNLILEGIITDENIKKQCKIIVDEGNNDGFTPEAFKKKLDDIISDSKTSDEISEEILLAFKRKLELWLISLINDGNCPAVKRPETLPQEGYSFATIIALLEKIKSLLSGSKKRLEEEASGHNTESNNKDKERLDILKNNQGPTPQPNPGLIDKIFRRNKVVNVAPQNNANQSKQIRPIQCAALESYMKEERAKIAAALFGKFISEVDRKIQAVDEWCTILDSARQEGNANVRDLIQNGDSKQENLATVFEHNIVEIDRLGNGPIFRYENMLNFAKEVSNGTILDSYGKWSHSLKLVRKEAVKLVDYLSKASKEIENNSKEEHIVAHRTDCQQKIDSLIDLSTPTMQIDYHGCGNKVKLDHFWYVMTDCPEEIEGNKEGAQESVGSLLKKLIEQNTLGVKVNLVHVKGWHNQAYLYRVDSAVPAYFVEGVCEGEYGGLTLEGCYEELKKTKRTYTPFSHKDLQEKLENAVCVLKPHDDVAESEAMEHWINFTLLGLIDFESSKGTNGKYTIKSDKLGVVKNNKLDNLVKIFDLGNTRVEAFNTFSRYCKTLVGENLIVDSPTGFGYKEAINRLEYPSIQDYEDRFIISGTKYLDTIFVDADGNSILKWHDNYLSWQDYNKHLDENDPEYKQLKKEVEFIEARTSKYNDDKTE